MTITAVDLFAGAGGFSEGAKQAGVHVLWAANHWPEAVRIHAVNHPDTKHVTQDLHQADWTKVPAHDLLLASPACQGHSVARGKERPQHDAARSTAWAVISALEAHRPECGVVENVAEFLRWVLYPVWEQAVKTLGYSVSPHIIDAADHGVPQNRVRLFLVLTRSRNPIQLNLPKRPWVPVSEVVDWSAGDWSAIDRPKRATATLERIKNGRERFGDRFVVYYYGSAKGGRSIDRPIGAITTSGNHHALVDGNRMRFFMKDEVRKFMGFPAGYVLPSNRTLAVHLLGNAVCPPVAADVITALKASA
jgi:DNA (cytosine-5)-methyltransferase 1